MSDYSLTPLYYLVFWFGFMAGGVIAGVIGFFLGASS